MVLVAGEHRRRGLGTRLLKRCIAALVRAGPRAGARCHARRAARSIARSALRKPGAITGWREATAATTRRACRRPDGTIIRPIADADWAALCAYDAAAFGADRSALLQRLRGRLPAAELVAERGDRIAGFMLGRNGRSASQIGPLVAEDDDVAQALLARALPAIEGPIYIDLADTKTELRAWLAGCGFAAQRPLTRMLLGRATGFDDTSRTFAVVGPEFG